MIVIIFFSTFCFHCWLSASETCEQVIDYWSARMGWCVDVCSGGGEAGSKASRESRGPRHPHEGAGAAAEGGQWLLFWRSDDCDYWLLIRKRQTGFPESLLFSFIVFHALRCFTEERFIDLNLWSIINQPVARGPYLGLWAPFCDQMFQTFRLWHRGHGGGVSGVPLVWLNRSVWDNDWTDLWPQWALPWAQVWLS